MEIRRAWCRAALGFVCLFFAGEAKAIELFRVRVNTLMIINAITGEIVAWGVPTGTVTF